ncbi:hypothetical protein GCM10011376_25130 [Nocardioides flavus (ex Wang et al. 2016)]|uniref:DUF6542 domain-containing protein n=1 Tax=Nocardioides flavus (ex Wang et al. 2016) TaxID=2058780 RepID=A0ABQ3HJQ8_9ACTN|nr:DUF6542 domain-containing protein [Nocardioides flavus (ex Wang et al. 2016)]GHE17903.1 hypothetical protein GCM10011376_25130 [Nocardioides flavus (ex Wang et al. 2016)]
MDHAAASWEVGHEPGPQVVSLGVALTLTAVSIDVLLAGRLTLFFDLCFVALSLGLAALVRRRDFYMVALLPPLLMTLVFAFVALVARSAVADPRDSLLQAVISGVATHGVALFAGYALSLGWLGWRLHRESEAGVAAELERELGQSAG